MKRAFADSPRVRLVCIALATLIIAQLFYLGAKPFAVGLFPEPWDKLAHLVTFGVITLLLSIGSGGRRQALVFFFVAMLGALDEWHQASLPGRSVDIYDFLTDVCAAGIAIALFAAFRRRSANRASAVPCHAMMEQP